MEFKHVPVLLKESIEGLNIDENGIYVDCTVGAGGHSKEILKRLTKGKLIAIDQDVEALDAAKVNLAQWAGQVDFVHSNFSRLDEILREKNIDRVDGILMDIGVSSYQLDRDERGFSYHAEAQLDMRMDAEADIPTAADIVNTYDLEGLSRIFYEYGEERWSKRIAEFIVNERVNRNIKTTGDLVEIIKKAVPKKARMDKHPARKVFQALRIEVNGELKVLEDGLRQAVKNLAVGGRLCIIDFHSLEDRIVKELFKEMASDCICPPGLPVCICNHKKEVRLVNRKPIVPGEEEIINNPRARSAKLRIVEKLED